MEIGPSEDSERTRPLRSPLRWVQFLLRSMVYGLYERRLLTKVRLSPVPRHLAIIMDGNRRFAQQQGLSDMTSGHAYGARKVRELIQWCDDLQISAVTLWGLSLENLRRQPAEIESLFSLISGELDKLSQDSLRGGLRRRVVSVGRLDLLPESLRDKIGQVQDATARFGPWMLNIAIAYSGRDEIIQAMRSLLLDRSARGQTVSEIAEALTEDVVKDYLYRPDIPEPDLVIRTSGEVRLSGFMTWQSAYSELYFCDAFWPAFRKIDFLRAIRSYQGRRRRFGL